MESTKVEQLLMMNAEKFPVESLGVLRQKFAAMDETKAVFALSRVKDPTIALILSILVGGWGVDRFYIGSIGAGVIKLLTGGGCGIWWLIDICLIMNATRKKNFESVLVIL